MYRVGAHIARSPSDLNDYVECPHLTTLALEVARGERARPFVADEHAELLRRKGEAHERAYLCKAVFRGVVPDGVIVGRRQINLANVSRTRIEVGERYSQTR